ncbi:hypothetical protein RN001_001991 [Aquatica leii]|uniref:Protein phosphatase 1 regulatory subunit 21 N-terminal domain-containing protein n=1 Tax=Aquatica leii TaxID=1421715 RepID=A0AAN7SSR4_9COLE|nr:hypothetical protein RN001_001991 [Aquatica leii]
MEKPTDLEKNYQIIALEYSKVRSQATVLKKAVIDEQARNVELKELIKDLELKIRRHNQEMDSLTFRNDQLTKRISVLQQELQSNSHMKKSKHKHTENTINSVDFGILDEELHKKIIENAELVSSMVDKDLEIANYKEKVDILENKIKSFEKLITTNEEKYLENLSSIKKELIKEASQVPVVVETNIGDSMNTIWRQEAERWRIECELLRAKPEANERLTEYYETQIRELLEVKQLAQSEASSLWAENAALGARLEQLSLEKNQLENNILSNVEELHLTSDNYKTQLDAMTEHLANQNEKIAKQCDEIQVLKHKLTLKK